MRIGQDLGFFCRFIHSFFLLLFLPFFSPFLFLYLLPFIIFLSTGNVLASTLQRTWKGNIDQLEMTWPILPPIFHLRLDTFFWNSSARIWSMLKMDTLMNGSVLAVLAAYQNNLVMPKNDDVTSLVVQCLFLQMSTKLDFSSKSQC